MTKSISGHALSVAAIVVVTAAFVVAPSVHAQQQRSSRRSDDRGLTQGAQCSDPFDLGTFPAAAPHESADETSAGFGDDIDDSSCLDDFATGEDVFYGFTVDEQTCLTITLDADTEWIGMAINDACNDFDSCLAVVDSVGTSKSISMLFEPGDYLIMVDTFAPPSSATFDLSIDLCPIGACCLPDDTCADLAEPACVSQHGLYQGDGTLCEETLCPTINDGDTCHSPIAVPLIPGSLPYFDNDNTTAGRGNYYSTTCLGSFDDGEDIVYQLDVKSEACIEIKLDANTPFVAMALFAGCPFNDINCLATSATFTSMQTLNVVLGKGMYYLMVDTFPPPTTVTFDLTISDCPIIGACCLPDASCISTSDVDCEEMSGTFQGEESSCIEVSCPDIEFGACCLPDDSCLEMDEPDCLDLDGFFQGDGSICLETDCDEPPANDECADAIAVELGDTPFTNRNATTDGPAHNSCLHFGDNQVNQDVWFTYTAECNGELTITTCEQADFDTKIAVYLGDSCDPEDLDENLLVCVDEPGIKDCGLLAEVVLDAQAAETYLIRVGGFSDGLRGETEGEGILSVFLLQTFPACAGDANGDGVVNVSDLLAVINTWGSSGPGGDINADCVVNVSDLLVVINNWGNTCDES